MLYKPDWERTQQKFIEFWNKENHDRPLITISGLKDGYIPKKITAPEKFEDRWTNIEYVIESSRESFASTFFGGEAFPNLWPNLGPDIFGAILGDKIAFGENTSWSLHTMGGWENAKKFEFNPENKWWKKIKQMTEAVVEDANGNYLVGITDLHPGADGLVSLRGPENLSMDLFDNPDEVKKAIFELSDVFKTVFDELYNITTKKQRGTSNWLGVWHPEKFYVTSCDFIGMLSSSMFMEFIEPELLSELDWMDASIFHLDGPSALRHLDALLEIPKLNGVQWCYGAGQPTARFQIEVLKKIQNAGKLIHISVEPADLDTLLEQLKPEGLIIDVLPIPNDISGTIKFTEQEAKDILKKIDNSYKRKLY
jgi:hypothetical protein